MHTQRFAGFVGAVGFVAMAATLAGCDITVGASRFTVTEEKKFTVTGTPQVELSTFDGSIEVRGWDKAEVRVEIEKHGLDQAAVDRIQVKATQTGNTIAVDVPKPAGGTHLVFGQSPSARLIVSVPMQSVLKIESGDGSVSLKRVNGKVNIRTDDGSVRISETRGELFVRTGDGSIQAEEIEGQADLETHDGSITVDGVLRGLRADTGDGSIKLTARKGSVMDSDWTATTSDGSIQLRVADGFSAQVDAESGDGGVRVGQLVNQAEGSEDGKRHRQKSVRGAIGAGGKTLKLRSGSGSITVSAW